MFGLFKTKKELAELKKKLEVYGRAISVLQRSVDDVVYPAIDINDLSNKFDTLCEEIGADIVDTEEGIKVEWKSKNILELSVNLPKGERVIGITAFRDAVIVGTTSGVYRFKNGRFMPVPFQIKK